MLYIQDILEYKIGKTEDKRGKKFEDSKAPIPHLLSKSSTKSKKILNYDLESKVHQWKECDTTCLRFQLNCSIPERLFCLIFLQVLRFHSPYFLSIDKGIVIT